MKKIFTIIALLLVTVIYSQENTKSPIADKINLQPYEVFSSGILTMDFEDANRLKYIISKNDVALFEKEINKAEGPQAVKIDFSTLENGMYSMHVFVETTEVKIIPFKKS